MQLSVKGKQVDVGSALRSYIEEQLSKDIKPYFPRTIDAHVTLSREAHMFRVDILVHAGRGITLQSNACANEPYPAFDIAVERIKTRLKRYRERIKERVHSAPSETEGVASSYVISSEEKENHQAGEHPVIVAEMTTPVENLSVSEAVMRLDLGELPALLFRNRAHGVLNMIYRRADGNIGWVDPSNPATPAIGV